MNGSRRSSSGAGGTGGGTGNANSSGGGGAGLANNSGGGVASLADRVKLRDNIGYKPLTLIDVHNRIHHLCRRIPTVPDSGFSLESAEEDENPGEAGEEDKEATAAEAPAEDKPASMEMETAAGKAEEDSGREGIVSNKRRKTTTTGAATSNPATKSTLPQPNFPCRVDKAAVREWAATLQSVLEEFHLLVACVSPATYVWGTDRSGAADQNLSLLSSEMVRSQEQIMARVTPRLNDVLAPVVTLITDKTVTERSEDGKQEIKQNYFITTQEDPDYVDLCYNILARNAGLLRQVVLSNLDKLLQAIQDYLNAKHKDSQHDARGFVY